MYENNTQPFTQKAQAIREAGIDYHSADLLLEYARACVIHRIENLRKALEKVWDVDVRHEYLARIDSLQCALNDLSTSHLSEQLVRPNKQELNLSVR